MENIWIALIEGGLTLLGICVTVIVSNKRANKKLEEKVDKLVEHDELYESLLEANVYTPETYPAGWKLV